MTHDELLALINDEIEVCEPECNQHQRVNAPWLALYAVVELHKPKLMAYMGNPTLEADTCEHCGYLFFYPCPTIQAIEKELA